MFLITSTMLKSVASVSFAVEVVMDDPVTLTLKLRGLGVVMVLFVVVVVVVVEAAFDASSGGDATTGLGSGGAVMAFCCCGSCFSLPSTSSTSNEVGTGEQLESWKWP